MKYTTLFVSTALLPLTLALALALTPSCGGSSSDGDSTPCSNVDVTANPGFVCPDSIARAFSDESGAWEEVGPADFSCLGTASGDMATSVEVTLSGVVSDFQSGKAVASAQIDAFPGVDFASVLATTTSDAAGNYSLTLPAGQKRFGFKVTAAQTMDTYLLNEILLPDTAEQTSNLNSVSERTADTLPFFVGISRTEGSGVLAGSISDCQDDRVANVIATVSSTQGKAAHLAAAQTFYFSAGDELSLPVTHTTASKTQSDGLFMVVELPVAPAAFLQVWGYTPDQDPTRDELTLLAEIPSPVVAESVITTGLAPLRQ